MRVRFWGTRGLIAKAGPFPARYRGNTPAVAVRPALAGQMQYTYFPVSLEQFAGTLRFHDLVEGAFAIEDVRVTAQYLNHPALALGYRLEADGVTVVYATDHEPHRRTLADGDADAL